MENKKTIIGIIIVLILIIGLIGVSYFYNIYNNEQLRKFTEETNKILQSEILDDEKNNKNVSKGNYGIIEKNIKDYINNIKELNNSIDSLYKEINPNSIFSADNLNNKNMDKIDLIIEEYEKKNKNYEDKIQEMSSEKEIMSFFEKDKILLRKSYYENLYKTVMLSDAMKNQFDNISSKENNKIDKISKRIENLEKIKKYLIENNKYWSIKEDKIQFNNVNKMAEYYNLLNEFVDK